MPFKKESDFEKALITILFDKGWEKDVLKNATEQDLIKNWANILYDNNRDIDRLNNHPLTDGEMQQIIEQITSLKTPLKLNGFINGKTVAIKRDNPDDKQHFGKEISLKIYDRKEIASGYSRYQIVQQPKFPTKHKILNDRRGDLMLLINGMPVIHIELKRSGVPVSQAYHQIEKYSNEGVFTGLFSLVQIFVAMEPSETVYFANPGVDGKFNPDYYFHWADFNNEPINDWKDIASSLLSIPMAHQLIGFYTVADDSDGVLKVMRSYQYYAANAISDRVAKIKWDGNNLLGGYIWHTTGSGKTMTSFKSAQLIANSKDADKVIFLMDRIELGTQSLREYTSYAEENEAVQATENTGVLVTKLKSSDPANTLIVTSIQKMSNIKDEAEGSLNAADIALMNAKRIVFIIDEAHRSTFGDMLIDIKNTFPSAIFFGFTGTPIHKENQKKKNTTSTVFGDELHRYSIADGIRDKNVLGFDPYRVATFKDRDVRKEVALEQAKVKSEADIIALEQAKAKLEAKVTAIEQAIAKAKSEEEVIDLKQEKANIESEVIVLKKKLEIYYKFMDPGKVKMAGHKDDMGNYTKGIEDYLPSTQYLTKEHQRKVVEDILDNWLSLSHGGKFHALFATSSIPEAIDYYRLIKKERPALKVTALFDSNIDNGGGVAFKQDGLVEIIEDYNARYEQDFKIATHASFKRDIASRLAHKDQYKFIDNTQEQQLDILIVVDQMLTGFDSKWLNTLYMDKLLKYQHIIQAFSRTNRLFGVDKPFGTIKYYRKPHSMERNVNDAVKLYSGDKPIGLFVQKLEKNLIKMNAIFDEIFDLFQDAGVANFEKLPSESSEKAKFAKLFKELNDYLETSRIQGFKWEKSLYEFSHGKGRPKTKVEMKFDENTYLILALRYKELFSSGGEGSGGVDAVPFDLDGYLTEIDTGMIDANYMNSRFDKYLKALDGASKEITEQALNDLHKTFASLTQEEQKYANIFLHDIQRGDVVVDENKTLRDYITEYQTQAKDEQIHRFVDVFGIDEKKLRILMGLRVTSSNINEYGRFDELKKTVDKSKAKEYFEKRDGEKLILPKVNIKFDELLRRFILEGGFELELGVSL